MKDGAREKHTPYGPYEKYFKRPLDALCALAAIVLLCWLYAIVAVLVRVKLGSPVLFTQMRPGKDEKIFKLYKFRSMTDERDENGELLPEEVRLTPFGSWLRSTSLDELPELWNVLKGDMSLVGPRPLLVRYLPRYNAHQARRHEVLPGITGLAQVHGRNTISWEEKFDWDVKYVDKITFLVDVKTLLLTVGEVFRHDDVSFDSTIKEAEFWGDAGQPEAEDGLAGQGKGEEPGGVKDRTVQGDGA